MAEYDKSMPVREDEPLESEDKTSHVGTNSVNIRFSQDVMGLEIANNSSTATIYLNISGGTATVTSGIPIYAKQYYSADKKIKQNIGISLISDTIFTDVRIIGHYNLDAEQIG
jgi:hypothetical protein